MSVIEREEPERWTLRGSGSYANPEIVRGRVLDPDERVEVVRADAHAGAVSRVETLEAERQAVLDVVNLYGDEVLHAALDGIGWPTTGGQSE